MLAKIRTSPSGRAIVLALVCVAVVLGGFLVGRATAAQPHMQAALDHLQAAKAELQLAEPDKGGHRAKAIALVNDAIVQVQVGMGYAATQ
ncbi:MAG: hypothetical protein ABR961_08645 [Thermoanaerobaculaceae bacterium]|jgi:hypothetical protein